MKSSIGYMAIALAAFLPCLPRLARAQAVSGSGWTAETSKAPVAANFGANVYLRGKAPPATGFGGHARPPLKDYDVCILHGYVRNKLKETFDWILHRRRIYSRRALLPKTRAAAVAFLSAASRRSRICTWTRG
jgi:hypothetical protein